MKIEFDPAKDATNKRKHGLSLALAEQMNWDEAVYKLDSRFSYGELRMQAILPMGSKFYVAVFTERGEATRIISLRTAENKEVDEYVRELW
jgi:uncharacterized DUF497 family protein